MSIVNGITASLDQTKISILITPAESLRGRGDEVSVVVTYNNTLLTPFLSSLVPNPLSLTASTVMRAV